MLSQQDKPFLPLRLPIFAAIGNPAALAMALLIEAVSEPSHLYVFSRIAEQGVFNFGLFQLTDELFVVHIVGLRRD